jgi:phosphoserine phosphatase RsbU/P
MVYYTDGVTEAENPQRDYFGERRLGEAVVRSAGQSAQEILNEIMESLETFCDGVPPFDDQTIVVVCYTGS